MLEYFNPGVAAALAVFTGTKPITIARVNTRAIFLKKLFIKLVNATQEALKEALMVGAEVTLKAAKTATDYKKGNYGLDNYTKVITDLIRITSDNELLLQLPFQLHFLLL